MITLSAGKLWGIRRLADSGGRFKMTAVDQRPPIVDPIREKRGTATAPWEDVAAFKAMLIKELQSQSTALLLDPNYAYPKAATLMDPRKGLILTLEESAFTETPEGRLSAEIDGWSVEKIRRSGGDAVKVLAWYRPDASETVKAQQKDFVKRVADACTRFDIPFVFELLVYPLPGEAGQTKDYVEMASKHADHVLESVRVFAAPEFGVDLFKLESPVPAKACDGSREVQALFNEMGKVATRPWVMLSAGATMSDFRTVLEHAYRAGASGYLAGRAIWLKAFEAFPAWETIRSRLRGEALAYMQDLNALTDAHATPWFANPAYSGVALADAGPDFRHRYGEIPDEAAAIATSHRSVPRSLLD